MSSTNWENLPSTNTPVNAPNLNKIEKKIKSYFVPVEIENIAGWYLVADGSITGYDNIAIKLSIIQLFSGGSGILYINLRSNGNENYLRVENFEFESNINILPDNFQLKLDGKNFYLYCNCSSYQQYQIKIMEISNLQGRNKPEEDLVTFYTPEASNTVALPEGTTPPNNTNEEYTQVLSSGQFMRFPLPTSAIICCRSSAPNFEAFRIFAYVGPNKHANHSETLLSYDYLNNSSASVLIQYVAGDPDDINEYIDITNNGSIDLNCSIKILHLL